MEHYVITFAFKGDCVIETVFDTFLKADEYLRNRNNLDWECTVPIYTISHYISGKGCCEDWNYYPENRKLFPYFHTYKDSNGDMHTIDLRKGK